MRLCLAAFLALVWCLPVTAQELERSAVHWLQTVCVNPDSTTAMIAAGKEFASDNHWGPGTQQRGPLSFGDRIPREGKALRRPEKKPPDLMVIRDWPFGDFARVGAKVRMMNVVPEFPNLSMDICAVMIPADRLLTVSLEAELLRQLGQRLAFAPGPKPPMPRKALWFFAADRENGRHCSRAIAINYDYFLKSVSLLFYDFRCDANRGPICMSQQCPK